MKHLWLLLCLVAWPALAQQAKIGVAPVRVGEGVGELADVEGKKISLDILREAIDDHLLDAFHGTRRFEVVARGDLDALTEEFNLQRRDGAATRESFRVPGLDYLVVLDLDFYQDIPAQLVQPASGRVLVRRDVQLGGVLKIYDAATGSLLESVNLLVEPRSVDTVSDRSMVDGDPTRIAIRDAAAQFSALATQRVVEVLYPATVLAFDGQTVTLNRGDQSGVQVGQVFELFVPGEPLIDPDTGEVLGRAERFVGAAEVVRVRPGFCVAAVLDRTGNIEKGCIARPAPPMQEGRGEAEPSDSARRP